MRKREIKRERECKINLYKLFNSKFELSVYMFVCMRVTQYLFIATLQGVVLTIPNVAAVAAAVGAHTI